MRSRSRRPREDTVVVVAGANVAAVVSNSRKRGRDTESEERSKRWFGFCIGSTLDSVRDETERK